MPRIFNTAGPCKPAYHYMLPPERRLPGLRDVIDEMHYFVIHAPRQTGKTTVLQALAERLTAEGRHAAVLVSAELGAAGRALDLGAAEANGGGTIVREYAIGRGRMDLCLRMGDVTLAMELKTWRRRQRNPLQPGLAQLDRYLDGLGLETGWLVIFDQRARIEPTATRTRRDRATSPAGREITVVYA